jgi:toxin ParE1/3/4
MTGRYVLSPRAQTDLDEIWDYSAQTWGIDQADSYARELWRRIEALAAHPKIGQACAHIRPGYFKSACGSHVLFYRLTAQGTDVVRILHERMDFERHIP